MILPFDAPGADQGRELIECGNPRCDEQFVRLVRPGQRQKFHSDDCRREAERDLRRTNARIEHHVAALEQLRAQAAAYTQVTAVSVSSAGPTAAQLQAAREALLEVKGMARFLAGHEGEFASDLLRLYEALVPIVDVR